MDTAYEDDEEGTRDIPASVIFSASKDNRTPYEKKLAVCLIMASTFFERIGFYTLAINLALNAETEKLKWNCVKSTFVSLLFCGVNDLSILSFAVISDWKLGRAKTILIGFFLYSIGYIPAVLLTLKPISNCAFVLATNSCLNTSTDPAGRQCLIESIIIFTLIAVSGGAVQSNMAVFGAEQMKNSDITSRFFDVYVIIINMSAIFATWIIRTIYFDYEQNPTNSSNLSPFTIPSIVASAMVLFATGLFLIGRRYYVHVKPYDSVVNNSVPVIINAVQTWRKYKSLDPVLPKTNDPSDCSNENENSTSVDQCPSSFLDYAKTNHYGKFNERIVNDVKSLQSAVIIFIILIPLWLINNQLNMAFPIQGKYMHESYDNNSFVLFNDRITLTLLSDPITIILGLIILNMFVYKNLDSKNRSQSIVVRSVLGMCFGLMSMCAAGTVEVFRQKNCSDSISSLSIYYQLPQNIFMGLSEIFTLVASFEYAYFAAPRSGQTLFMGLHCFSVGSASFAAIGYYAIFSSAGWTTYFQCTNHQRGQWNSYNYFYFLAGFQLIIIIIFIACQKRFQIIKIKAQ